MKLFEIEKESFAQEKLKFEEANKRVSQSTYG